MSSSRRRRRSPLSPTPGATAPAEQQVVAAAAAAELVSRLRALLPPGQVAAAADGNNGKASRARVLREACVYIRRLHAEVDGLAERLARLPEDPSVAAAAVDAADDELIRNLLM